MRARLAQLECSPVKGKLRGLAFSSGLRFTGNAPEEGVSSRGSSPSRRVSECEAFAAGDEPGPRRCHEGHGRWWGLRSVPGAAQALAGLVPAPTSPQDGAASPSCTSSEWPVCVTAETLRFRNTVSRGFQGTASPWPIAMIRLIKRKTTSCVIRRRAPAWSAGHTRVLHPQVHLPARPQSPANGRQAGDALAASILVHKPPVSPSAPAGAQPTAGRAASRGGSGRLPRAPRTEVPRECVSVTVT